MNLGLYLHMARRWVLLSIIPALIVGSLAYLYTQHEAKIYQTTATLYVEQASPIGTGGSGTDVFSSEAVIPTYSSMITSPVIAASVDKSLAPRYPGYRLEEHGLVVGGALAGSAAPSTQLMDISLTDTNSARGADAANAVAQTFITYLAGIEKAKFKGDQRVLNDQLNRAQANIQITSERINSAGAGSSANNLRATLAAYQTIYQTLLQSAQEFRLQRDTALNGVKIFSPATPNVGPIGPHPARNGLLFAFASLLLFAGAILGYDYIDDSPTTPEQVEEIVGAPVLGTVPQFNTKKGAHQLIAVAEPRSPLAEAYRVIRTNIKFLNVDQTIRSLVVTSASPSEGKSTTAGNLAHVFAEGGSRVTLVDGDLRRPSLHRLFALKGTDGLTNALVDKGNLNGQWLHTTKEPNLAVIASGPLPPRAADLLGSKRMTEFVDHLQERMDLVIIDSPPVLAVADAAILSTAAGGVLLVVDPAKSKKRELRRAREAIETVGGRIVGVVINRLARQGSSHYYYYYRHNYGYDYKYGEDEAKRQKTLTKA